MSGAPVTLPVSVKAFSALSQQLAGVGAAAKPGTKVPAPLSPGQLCPRGEYDWRFVYSPLALFS